MPVYIEALEGVSDGVFYVGDMEHDHEVGDSMNNAKLAKKIAGRILKMDGPNKEEEIKIHWWNVS